MSQMTPILLKDDANPLVEITLVPITNRRPLWRAQVTGVPVDGQVTLEMLANTRLPDGNWRRVFKVNNPVMETLGASGTSAGYVAPSKVAFVNSATISMLINQRSSDALNANLLKFIVGCVAGASSVTATGTLDGASAADAWKNSSAPFTRFMIYGEDAT